MGNAARTVFKCEHCGYPFASEEERVDHVLAGCPVERKVETRFVPGSAHREAGWRLLAQTDNRGSMRKTGNYSPW